MKLRSLIALIVLIGGAAHGEEVKPREVIERFLEAESRLQAEFQHYTYSQTILISGVERQGLGPGGAGCGV